MIYIFTLLALRQTHHYLVPISIHYNKSPKREYSAKSIKIYQITFHTRISRITFLELRDRCAAAWIYGTSNSVSLSDLCGITILIMQGYITK